MRRNLCRLAALLSLAFVLASCGACAGNKAKAKAASGPQPAAGSAAAATGTVGTVTGSLRQVGNEPHIELVITGTSTLFEGVRDYYVVGPDAKKADAFFGATVEIRGRIWEEELRLAGSSGRVMKRSFIELESVSAVK